jgi:homocitrate synthase NifV
MIWVDQTLQEGLARGLNRGDLNRILSGLQELSVGISDVIITDWEQKGFSELTRFEKERTRGITNGTVEEVELANALGFKSIIISCAPHMGQGLISQVCAALFAAQKMGMKVSLCIENASQFSLEEIGFLWRDIPIDGIETFIYSDRDSLLDPLSTTKIMAFLRKKIPATLEFHGHNAYGLASANGLAALQAGIKNIAVAVAGIGLYGHAAIEELIMARKSLLGEGAGVNSQLAQLCSQMISLIGLNVPSSKSIIGRDIFAHESGIHVDGVVKNPQLYEAFSPEEVGLERRLVIGKHSGTSSIQAKFRQWNQILPVAEAQILLKQVRELAVAEKKEVDDNALWEMYQAMINKRSKKFSTLEVKHQRSVAGV